MSGCSLSPDSVPSSLLRIPLRSLIVVGRQRKQLTVHQSPFDRKLLMLCGSHTPKQKEARAWAYGRTGVFVCPIDKGLSRQYGQWQDAKSPMEGEISGCSLKP